MIILHSALPPESRTEIVSRDTLKSILMYLCNTIAGKYLCQAVALISPPAITPSQSEILFMQYVLRCDRIIIPVKFTINRAPEQKDNINIFFALMRQYFLISGVAPAKIRVCI